MLFNSLAFAVFLPTVFLLYWVLERRAQNLLIIVASYVFYGWWDWRFLSLIWLSSTADFAIGWLIGTAATPKGKKRWLYGSFFFNFGLLGFFKYYNFFAASLHEALTLAGIRIDPWTLQVILPVGISFYTFQSLSYTIDVFRGNLPPHRNYFEFLAFVSFFPQLVAGPIERASHLLGQFRSERSLNPLLARDGFRQMLWGFFKKICIADALAPIVNTAYADIGKADGTGLLLATIAFSFQIYCDFSGYSDIAIGCARIFGFNIMTNFDTPYFSRNVTDFWRRWHISLSTWFRDYLYIPLGGSHGSRFHRAFNVVFTFTVSGLWHGANWTYVFWGLINGLYFLPSIFLRRYRSTPTTLLRKVIAVPVSIVQMAITYSFITFTWIFFRASSLSDAFHILGKISHEWPFPQLQETISWEFALIPVLLTIEWFKGYRKHPLEFKGKPGWGVFILELALVFLTVMRLIYAGDIKNEPFIYFQF